MALEVLTFFKAEWIKSLWKKLGKLRGERANELDHLRNIFFDPNVLKYVYVVPDLQDRNPADVYLDELLAPARQSAFERINQFFQGDLPLEKDGRHQMFILSDAGMGKTSLLLMLKLIHLTNFWPQKYSCELFKLGDDTLKQIHDLPNKGETFLLLDALDEDPQAWKQIKERLLELLRASEDFRRVIISSRTQFFPETESDSIGRPEIKVLSGYQCPVLYHSPFSSEQVQEFINKKLPLKFSQRLLFRREKVRQQRLLTDHLLKQMQDLQMRPLLLYYLDELLKREDPEQQWNSYTVYQTLIDQWLNREVRKLQKQHDQRRVPERKELFKACLQVAEYMQRQGTQVIAEEELQQLILADKNISWLEKFELGGHSLLNRNSDRTFRFSHYTMQEFLLAWGVVHEQLTEQKLLRATDQLVQFVQLAGELRRKIHHFNFTNFNWQKYIQTSGPIHPLFVPKNFFYNYLDRNQSSRHNDIFLQDLKHWLQTKDRRYISYFLEVIQLRIQEEWCKESEPKKRKSIEHYLEESLPKFVESLPEFHAWNSNRRR